MVRVLGRKLPSLSAQELLPKFRFMHIGITYGNSKRPKTKGAYMISLCRT
jgi:hypothetical protein